METKFQQTMRFMRHTVCLAFCTGVSLFMLNVNRPNKVNCQRYLFGFYYFFFFRKKKNIAYFSTGPNICQKRIILTACCCFCIDFLFFYHLPFCTSIVSISNRNKSAAKYSWRMYVYWERDCITTKQSAQRHTWTFWNNKMTGNIINKP